MLPISLRPCPDLINVRNLDLAPAPILARMMRNGTAVDLPYLASLSEELGDKKADLEREIRKHVPADKFAAWKGDSETEEGDGEESENLSFNVNSPEQIAWFLFEILGLDKGKNLKRTPDGKRVSTGKKQLETLKAAHEVVKLLLDYREVTKLKSTYTDSLPHKAILHPKGRCPYCSIPGDERGHREAHYRIHTTFTSTRAATGRLASKNPNLQNIPKRTKEGKRIRNAFYSQPGMKWVSADFSQIELRLLAHYSGDPYMAEIYRLGGDIHTMTALKAFKVTQAEYDAYSHEEKEEFDNYKRLPCKNVNFGVCIAKGQLVLTDHGLVPIENVRSWMLVWDGINFVGHEGVVYKGRKKVIHHDGLWATPSHKVWIEGGGTATIKTASSLGLRLAVTASGSTPIRYTHDHVKCDFLRERVSVCDGNVQPVWSGEEGTGRQPAGQEDESLQVQTEVRRRKSVPSNGPLARDGQPVYEHREPAVEGLRRQRDKGKVQKRGRVHTVCNGYPPSSDVQKDQHRQDRQQRPLRTWESEAVHLRGESKEHSTECVCEIQGRGVSGHGCSRKNGNGVQGVQVGQRVHDETTETWGSLAGVTEHYSTGTIQEEEVWEGVEVDVYDIMNAGPNRRFTVAGKLVSNCYGLTGKGLQAQLVLSNIYWSEEECQEFIDTWFSVFSHVKKYMREQEYRVQKYGYNWDLWGRVRWYPGIHSAHRKIVAEALREAGNMPIQASSAGLTKYTMALMDDRDRTLYKAGYEFNPLLTIHDEVIYEAEDGMADDLLALNLELMAGAIELDVAVMADGKVKDRW